MTHVAGHLHQILLIPDLHWNSIHIISSAQKKLETITLYCSLALSGFSLIPTSLHVTSSLT